MLELTSTVPVKFKRRKVSAVRNFPKGCQVLAPEEEAVRTPAEENPSIDGLRSLDIVIDTPVDIPKESNGFDLDEKVIKMEGPDALLMKDESMNIPEICPKRYSLPKRREVSAVRHFPKGCVRNAPKIATKEDAVAASSKSKTDEARLLVDVEPSKEDEVMKSQKAEDGVWFVFATPEPKNVDGEKSLADGFMIEENEVRKEIVEPIKERKVQESSGGPNVESSKPKSWVGERSMADGPMIEEDEVRKKVVEPIIERKVHETSGEPKVKSPKSKNLGAATSVNLSPKVKNCYEGVIVKFPKANNLDGEAMVMSPKRKNLDAEVMVKTPKPNDSIGKATTKTTKPNDLEGKYMVKSSKPKNVKVEAMVKVPKPNNLEGKDAIYLAKPKNVGREPMDKSSKPNNLDGKDMVNSFKMKYAEGGPTAKSPKPTHLDGKDVINLSKLKNVEGEATVNSPMPKNLDGKDIVESPKPINLDKEASIKLPKVKKSYVEVMVNSTKPKNVDGEAMVKSPKSKDLDGEVSIKSHMLKNSETKIMIKPPKFKNLDRSAMVNSHKWNLDAEKRPMSKLEIVTKGGLIDSSIELEVKTSDSKQSKEKVGAAGNKARVKAPLSSNPREDIVEESHENILRRSTSEKKMEVSTAKEISKNRQVKDESGVNRPSAGVEVVNTGGKSLTGKHVSKLSIKGPKDGSSLKRKLAEESDDKGHVQDEESVEVYGDRLIVQALMSAEICPWRKGKKAAGTNSRSATPKFKAKNGLKILSKSLPSKGLSTSQHKNEDVEDDEYSVAQDDENGRALIAVKQSQELSITLPQCVSLQFDHNGANNESASARAIVKRTLRMFQWITRKFLQAEEAKARSYGDTHRVDLKAASILKESNNWVDYGGPILGDVPGVEVGDEFHYRVELSLIGIHRPYQAGIDYVKRDDGVILATSIVASGGYPDDIDSSDILIYSGSGGATVGKDKQAGDQKLERGNLALKNSIDAQTPVRVVYGFKDQLKGSDSHGAKMVSTFTYDGLYVVEKYWPEKGPHGFSVFKFQLRRILGQPEIAFKEVKKTKKSKIREGLIMKDISIGKEPIPICVINTIDNEKPMPFNYITQVIYPSSYLKKPPRGCDCTKGCSDSDKCSCATKNGGEIPFNYNGAIVQAKTLVYECGPSCKCPSSCPNRVSQHGIRIPLEVFKTEKRGWGVRSLYSIPSGSFICEYVGEMLEETDAEQRRNDEYLFDIGNNYDDHALWEGLPNPIPGLQSNDVCETVESGRYTIDAVEYSNVGRFINHSCSPNLYAQNVLYDHDDKSIPHIMFFAADNIPPLQELTYHYNYSIDQVHDEQGNIKRKDCFCGSSECTGRLY